MSLRHRVAFELVALAVLASLYLVLLPERPMWVDVGLGLLAGVLVMVTVRTTRERVWPPLTTPRRERLLRCSRQMLGGTLTVALLFAVVRGENRAAPLFTAAMLVALVLFILWATVQQTLFQLYLLGRLRALIPSAPPAVVAAVNGLLFGAVHLPDVEVTLLTIVGGAVWSWYYLRDRCLGPIALSHAVLGTTYYYWVRGDDLVLRWFRT